MDSSQQLQSDAFKRLYPDQFYARFIQDGLRPDGRMLGRARAVSIAPDVISTAEASASVKIGNTTALAGVKLEVFIPTDEEPDKGEVQVNVELTPLCSSDWRPGRPSESTHVITDAVTQILHTPGVLDLTSLCIRSGQAAFIAIIDIFILDADGSLLDAALLAAISALTNLKIPKVKVNAEGQVQRAAVSKEGKPAENSTTDAAEVEERWLKLNCIPLCVTCGIYNSHLIVDPTAEEENLIPTLVAVTLNEKDELLGLFKPGGAVISTQMLHNCIEAAALNYKTMHAILQQTIPDKQQAK